MALLPSITGLIKKVANVIPTAVAKNKPASTAKVTMQPTKPTVLFYPPIVVGGGTQVNAPSRAINTSGGGTVTQATKPAPGVPIQPVAPSIAKAGAKLAAARAPVFNTPGNPGGLQKVTDFEKSKLHDDIQKAPVVVVAPEFKSKLTTQQLHLYGEHKVIKSIDKLSSDTKKFEPYEKLTGISQERPELILMADFEPLYQSNSSVTTTTNSAQQTNVLAFFKVQMFLRELQSVLIKQQLVFSNDPKMQKQLRERKITFGKMIDTMLTTSKTLASIVSLLEKLKSGLNIKSSVSDVEFVVLATNYIKRFASSQSLIEYINSTHPTKYSIIDVLILFGFSKDNIIENFSSTKIWMQLLLETKHTLLTHSARFQDRTTAQQLADDNAITVRSFAYEVVSLKSPQPTLHSLFDIRQLQLDALSKVLGRLVDAYRADRLYTSLNVSSTTNRVAALLNILSKEYRYSEGLGKTNVKQTLETYFGYTLRTDGFGNQQVFDSIFGRVGNNITDFSTTANNSLASYAQIQARAKSGQSSNVGVLTLESKYIDGTDGTLTPGSEYYVDEVLQLNDNRLDVARIQDLLKIASTAYSNFSLVARGMNFLVDSSNPELVAAKNVKEAIADPRTLFKTISSLFLDNDGKIKKEVYFDLVGSIFEAAEGNSKIKSLLFLYFMTRITRSYKSSIPTTTTDELDDNSHTTEEIINQLMNELDAYGKNASALGATDEIQNEVEKNGQELVVRYFVKFTVRETLQKGSSAIIKIVEQLLNELTTAFIDKAFDKQENQTSFSRVSGSIDTSVMLVAFDIIVILIRRYTAMVITGISDGTTTDNYYVVSQINVNSHKSFMSGVSNLLVKEITLTQQAVFSIMNVLNKHVQMLTNASNFLTSKPVTQLISDLASNITDKEALQALISEQQISLLSSTVFDLSDLVKQHTSKSNRQQVDVNNNKVFGNTDEIVILDQGIVSERLRDAVLAFFSLPEYSRSTSNNKKIMSVGIPTGFMHRLNQRINVKNLNSSLENKQNDIITVNVYKINMENVHIIFRPIKFMFELSRFPVRSLPVFSENNSISSIDDISTGVYQLDDILRVVPMRVYGSTSDPFKLEYYKPKISSQTEAFASEEYSFMSNEQKRETYKNHVASLLLETYLNVMTGIRTSEFHFPITDNDEKFIEPEFTKTVIKKSLEEIITKNTVEAKPLSVMNAGTLFSKNLQFVSELAAYKNTKLENATTQTLVSNLSNKDIRAASGAVKAVSAFASISTTVSNHTAVSKQLLQPKKFDRVFNIIFDPDDFEIDTEKTSETPQGRASYAYLSKNNYLEFLPLGTELNNTGERARIKERDKNSGDVVFDKYFVTIETFGETV